MTATRSIELRVFDSVTEYQLRADGSGEWTCVERRGSIPLLDRRKGLLVSPVL
jgi:hypothetical protein